MTLKLRSMAPSAIGRYRIVRPLGRGGMGTVYEGFDDTVERRVALKVLHKEYQSVPEIVERFLNEARAANRIGHPGVVQVSECHTLPDGTAYLVMEYLDGQTLTQRLREHGGRLPLWMAINIASQIADTLHWGHERGIVHRDLKPDNIMIIADSVAPRGERCKLFDFGIAKLNASKSNSETQPTVILGTPGYMPPEQLRGASKVTAHSDVYSLGVILYQMVAGRRPFVADTDADLTAMVLRDEAPPISQFVNDVPNALAGLLRKMLSRQAVERPLMRAVLETLRELVQEGPGPRAGQYSERPAQEPAARTGGADPAHVPDTFVPHNASGKRRTASSGSATTSSEHQVAPPPLEKAPHTVGSLVTGQQAPHFAAQRMPQNKWVALAGGLVAILTSLIVLRQCTPNWGGSALADGSGSDAGQEIASGDFRTPEDLSTERELSMAQALSSILDMSSSGDAIKPFDMQAVRDLRVVVPPPCPPVFSPRCIHGKGLTKDQIQVFVDRLNRYKPKVCGQLPIILIREENWFRKEWPIPGSVPEQLVTDLLDDLYAYWAAKQLSFTNLPEKVEIVCR